MQFELEQATSPEFSDPLLRYAGTDQASVITGLAEGVYYYRVRAVDTKQGVAGAWSPVVAFRVEYMPMSTVWLLVGAGLIVFLATLSAILAGHAKAAREAPADSPDEITAGQKEVRS
jgi:hypothetical protein